jgi:Flp pilus assembly protein TadD
LGGGEAPAGLHTDLGIALAQTRRYDEALTHFREAARRQPASAAHLNNLGGILLQLDRLEEAAAQFEGALRLDPDLEDARLNLALVLKRLGRSG